MQDYAVAPNMAGVATLVGQSARKSIAHWETHYREQIGGPSKRIMPAYAK